MYVCDVITATHVVSTTLHCALLGVKVFSLRKIFSWQKVCIIIKINKSYITQVADCHCLKKISCLIKKKKKKTKQA